MEPHAITPKKGEDPKSSESTEDPTDPVLTLGEQRCHVSFNPSGDSDIDKFKSMCADAIDFLNDLAKSQRFLSSFSSQEILRCFDKAMTKIETAQMYGVKAIAKTLNK